jgi:hypothetical protein
MIKKNNFIFKISNRKNKKYDVFDKMNNYITSFGDNRYQHYKDKIGLYKHLDHLDNDRRKRYKLRHGTNPKPLSAGWFSLNYLW